MAGVGHRGLGRGESFGIKRPMLVLGIIASQQRGVSPRVYASDRSTCPNQEVILVDLHTASRTIVVLNLVWFWDLHNRGLLDLDPPYQRRSVWNQSYKDYFIDTILNGFPSPSIFLHQDISPEGVARYSVVDGRQRLSTLFDFANNLFPIGDDSTLANLRGSYFKDLSNDIKNRFLQYLFVIEYVTVTDEHHINEIFDRLNRNVARLTPQELRHARFSGKFIVRAEDLAAWMTDQLPPQFPMITTQARRQMKDVEITAQLLLLIEEGPGAFSQLALDQAFSDRDESWELEHETVEQFRGVVAVMAALASADADEGQRIVRSRLRNQADFYSLFGGLHELQRKGETPKLQDAQSRLLAFTEVVDDPDLLTKLQAGTHGPESEGLEQAASYYEAARSASNDAGPRRTRIDIVKKVVRGKTGASTNE